MNIAAMNNVVYGYDGVPVIHNVSLRIESGEFIAVSGPNGAAKSTLLRLLLGLVKPWSGEVSYAPDFNRKAIGYLPQQAASFNSGFPSKVIELVRSGCYPKLGLFRRFGAEQHALVEWSLRRAGMWEYRTRKIGGLSGGQKQKACIARVMAQQPDLVVLDEPVTGMDAGSRLQFYQWMRDYVSADPRRTVLMVTHGLDEARPYLDRVIRLEGKEEDCQCFTSNSCSAPFGQEVLLH
ncbi:metal ABC transporter ATP-binding protein [Paenibacillus cineris]|uniref:High-affinity zinc uptake system ATP-binding protein ZnuC n=1 Tax=Paenibacillus cineris TaxID=237530 RepID=A0ABQ4LBR1_9BACL|nr:metal ABC transporter ATP-binding protein [Paenibacillus cineris]GIO53398.1 high-affinity zinc uptake system ATP-binding protein ZnuC [Paenibacillus cineris]